MEQNVLNIWTDALLCS